jgi:preprotein translocase subunit YajC
MTGLIYLAQAGQSAPAQNPPSSPNIFPLVFLVLIVVVFYFMISRPQKKKDKERREMISRVGKGDKVITVGGLYGEVETAKDDYVILLVDPERGTTLKMRRSAVHEVVAPESVAEDKQ